MNRQFFLLALLATCSTALVFACGGDNGTGNDAGNDATTDANPGNDAASDASKADAGDAGSADAAKDGQSSDGGDGGIVLNLSCQDPSGCDGGAVCCGAVTLNGGTPPNCNIAAVSSTCAAGSQCGTVLQFSCNTTETVRLCAQPADCTEQAYKKCCVFQDGNQTLTFCANTQIAAAAGATCM